MQVNGPGAVKLSAGQLQAGARQTQALAASQHTSEMHQLLIYSGIALAIMAVISVALGWGVAGPGMRPLRTITAAAKDISPSSLHRRQGPQRPHARLKGIRDPLYGRLARVAPAVSTQ